MNYHNRCSRCLLPDNYPGIEFNDANICNYCVAYDRRKVRENGFLKNRYRAWMEKIIEKTKKENKSNYDCLLCYGGGKDSTYLLYLLTEEYKLNVLAYTFDNEFMSEAAKRNIQRTLRKINVDHVWYRPEEGFWNKLYSAAFKDILTNRSSELCPQHVCSQCSRVTDFYANKIAMENDIPLLFYGLSPHQLWVPKLVLPKYGVVLSYLVNKLLYSLGIRQRFSCTLDDKEQKELRIPLWGLRKVPYLITPFYALGYDIPKIKETVFKMDLIAPGDEHPLSSNCLLNYLMIDLDYRRFRYNPYLQEFSQLVREGNLNRREWLLLFEQVDQKIEEGTWERDKIDSVLKKLGLTSCYQEYIAKLK